MSFNGSFLKVRGYYVSSFELPRGCVLALPMDEGSGNTVYDQSGYGNHGTIYGASWVDGKHGKALSFENDYVQVSNSGSLNPTTAITVACWFKTNVVHEGALVWKPYSTYNPTYGIAYLGSSYQAIVGRITDSAGTLHETSFLWVADDNWHFLVLTYDGSAQKIYMDLILKRNRSWTGTIATSTYSLRIGDRETAHAFFKGIIDEVYIFNRALSQSEIKLLMDKTGLKWLKVKSFQP